MANDSKEPAKDNTGAGEGTGPGTPAAPAEQKPATTQDEPKVEPKKDAGEPAAKAADGSNAAKIELKLPEDSLLEAGDMERIAAFAKERGLSQDQAQALLEREHQMVATKAEEQKAQLQKVADGWVTELKADKEVGGESFNKNVELAKRVVDRFGTDLLKRALSETKLGNHPELVRIFARIGKSMSADTWVQQTGTPTSKKSLEDALYGSGTKTETPA